MVTLLISATFLSHITVTGKNANDVTPVITGEGYITVVNNGAVSKAASFFI